MKKLVVLLGALISGVVSGSQIELEKVYLHGAHEQAAQRGPQIEEARLVFYFNQKPKVQVVEKKVAKKQWSSVVVTVPNLGRASGELKTALEKIQQRTTDQYVLKVNQHKNGDMEITVTFDLRKINVAVDEFTSIGTKPGLSITLYHQPTIDGLKNAQQSILQVAHHAPTLVIDCGHGGKDTGAVGTHGAVEKDIALRVGKKLAQVAEKKGYPVTMARSDDSFLELDQRTSCAHNGASCVFISIHANHAQDAKAQGIETFYFERALFKPVFQTGGAWSADIMSDNLGVLSKQCADEIHKHLLSAAHSYYPQAVDRTVKKACSQVLMGAFVPAVLVELGFLSHPVEESYLINDTYLDIIVAGIMSGIDSFVKGSNRG